MKEPSEHTHAPDPGRVHVIRLKNELKARGASSDEATSTILFGALRTIPLNVVANLPLAFRQTDRGENFVLYEDDSMVIFTCDKNLSVLKECPHWFMDETFSICVPCQLFLE